MERKLTSVEHDLLACAHRDGVAGTEPIAIIGIGCRFPGAANDPDSYWHLLRAGVDAITDIPADRWDPRRFYDPEPGKPGKTNARWGGFIQGIDQFDPQFFGISPREAARMDPQQRLILEVAWEALEDAGVTLEGVAESKTAVFVGISSYDYMNLQAVGVDRSDIDVYTNTGGALSITANRISYCFNLKGPSAAVDTACSSALVGVHLACQSIWHEDCTMALAGGVNVLLTPDGFIGFSRLSMLSPDGRCKAFDAQANGFVRSEGAGIVVLKPLARALADKDRIYALIRATAVNQDGRTPGMTVPSLQSQAALVRDACRQAGILPASIQFVEAHGTGTLVGDPIEARALGQELSAGRPEGQACIIGSVKTNVGHLESASGIAGLIKLALSLKHRQIPPHLHCLHPNPDIPFETLRLRLPLTLEPWPEGNGPALAGINSFGFGGTNAHAILQGPPPDVETTRRVGSSAAVDLTNGNGNHTALRESSCFLLPLSTRSPEALKALALAYQQFLDDKGNTLSLPELCSNAGVRRSHLSHRIALVANSLEDLSKKLAAFAAGESQADVLSGHVVQGKNSGLAFVCAGQGPQWWAMGRQLLAQEPICHAILDQCDRLVRQLGGWSLWQELTADEGASRLQETAIAQPAIFALQAALAALWQSWGIVPDALIGHSIGEVAAGYIAGVLTLEDAVRVSFHRGRCMECARGKGKMLAVGLSLEEAQSLIQPYEEQVGIAAVNSPTSITLTGDASFLANIAAKLQQQEIFCRFLQVQYAFHSSQMDSVKEMMLEALQGIRPLPARIPLFSTVTGERVAGPEWKAEYWWQNVRQTVRFTDAVDRLLKTNHLTFVELSPHPVLASAVAECLSRHGLQGKVLPSLRRQQDERSTMLRSLGTLYTLGHPVTWESLAPKGCQFVRLPSYPWQRDRYWHESEDSRQFRLPTHGHPLLGHALRTPAPSWENSLDLRLVSYLSDHRVQGQVVLPGTAYLEMALAVGKEVLEGSPVVLEEVQMVKACFLSEGQAQTVQTVYNPEDSTFTIYGRTPTGNSKWITHARGVLRPRPGDPSTDSLCLDEIRTRCPVEMANSDFYARLKNVGLEYGPMFQGMQRLWQGNLEALGQIQVPEEVQAQASEYLVHPAILDSCVQVIFGTLPGASGRNLHTANRGVYLPVEIEQVRVHGRPGGQLWCHARLVEKNWQGLVANIRVFDNSGQLLVEARGLRCQLVGNSDVGETLDDSLYEYQWQFQPRVGQELTAGCPVQFPTPGQLAESIQIEAKRLCTQQRVRERYEQLDPRRDALCAALIWQALAQLGADLRPGQCFTAPSLVERLGIVPQHRRLVERYLGILEEDGFLRRQGNESTRWVQPVTWEVALTTDVEPQETWRSLLAEYPAFIAELILLNRCGQHLSQVLRGEINPLQLIFPEGALTTAEHLYQDSPCLRFYNSVAQQAIVRLLEHYAEERPLRILEIGAGTGGLTSYVLPVLTSGRREYVFTDLSNHFLSKAEQKFRDFPFVAYQRLDIENNPVEQGFSEHSFDLILASQVLHATTDLHQTLRHVRQLLAPAGLLLLVEAVRPPRWWDLVFGLTEGWWRFADSELRTSHPLLTFPSWQKVLGEVGFTEPTDICLPRGEEPFESAVIVAQGHGAESTEPSPAVQPSHAGVSPPTVSGRWLLFADRRGVGEKLAERLRSQGECCTLVFTGDRFERFSADHFQMAAASRQEMQQLLEELHLSEHPPWRGIVHLWNLDAPAAEAASTSVLETAQTTGCLSIVHLLQVWMPSAGNKVPRLWLVTGGAHSATSDNEPVALAQTPVWGLGRVIGNEFPHFCCKMVDLSLRTSATEIGSLFEELWSDDQEDEVALREAARFVHRYRRRPLDRPTHQHIHAEPKAKDAYRLEVSRSGSLDGLTLRARPRQQPGPGEVEIQILAAGLNFSDVLKALGLYPGLPDGPVPLGIECSGKISAVGPGVEGFQVGDEVMAIAPYSFSAFLTIPAQIVARKPPHLSFEEAATIPIAFLTADYALNYLGRLEAGERVLIHSATGGVGMAAIQLARRAGAEIFATAGTSEKREFLQALGIHHVMDSRSLAFVDEVLERTDGRGVDLILNSLAGEAIPKGLALLADHGRFLEIGKRDIYQNSRLGLSPFRKNLSLIAIDLDRALRERPAKIASQFHRLVQDVEQRVLAPLPHRVFPIANVAGAFRHMAQGKHIGKVVLSLQDQTASIVPSSEETPRFRAEATYLITGGLGGFGLTVAQWMVERGARHLVLVSRRGVTSPDVQRSVENLEQAGARVLVAKADASREDEMAALLAQIAQALPPLRGIVHTAMVLDDCLLLNLNHDRLQRVLAPKMSGAWNLHTQTQHLPLDFFVLFSSMSCVFGVAGQANYAAANAFLDALAHHRRALGLPALTINWGYLGGVGYVARNEKIGEGFKQMGVSSFTPEQALSILGRLLSQEASQVGVMRVSWGQQRKMFVAASVPPKFAQLYEEAGSDNITATPEGVPIRKALLAVAPDQRQELLQSMLRDKVARVLGSSAAKIDIDKPLTELGLDSLMAVELRNWIESELRLNLPLVELMRGPNVARLAAVLLEQLSRTDTPAPALAVPEPASTRLEQTNGNVGKPVEAKTAEILLTKLDTLSNQEVDSLLTSLLAEKESGQ